ncbi:unnamed protein product [Gordionus sp. m RMFG-2023]
MNIKQEYDELERTDGWEDLFMDIKYDSDFDYSFQIAQLPQNKERNRYSNVIPYDHNRIRLNPMPSLKSLSNTNQNHTHSNPTTRYGAYKNSSLSHKIIRSRWFKKNIMNNYSNTNSNTNLSSNLNNRNSNKSSSSQHQSTFNDYINASLLPIYIPCYDSNPKNLTTEDTKERERSGKYKEDKLANKLVNHNDKGHCYYYILTQGPLCHTSPHFWQMIWQYKVRCIIMLNNIVERGSTKCHPYYPSSAQGVPEYSENDEGKVDFALQSTQMDFPEVGIKVSLLKREVTPDFIVTLLEMTDSKSNLSRQVYHFHYTSWPDFGVPSEPGQFLTFLSRIKRIEAESRGGKFSSLPPPFIGTDYNTSPIKSERPLVEPNPLRDDASIKMTITHTVHASSNSDPSTANAIRNDGISAVSSASRHNGNDQYDKNLAENAPIVIHCSAGIGRTGTYCLIDYVLNLLNLNYRHSPYDLNPNFRGKNDSSQGAIGSTTHSPTKIDIPAILVEMRRYRAGLVQTADQLRFAYAVILKAISDTLPNNSPNSVDHSLYSSDSSDRADTNFSHRSSGINCDSYGGEMGFENSYRLPGSVINDIHKNDGSHERALNQDVNQSHAISCGRPHDANADIRMSFGYRDENETTKSPKNSNKPDDTLMTSISNADDNANSDYNPLSHMETAL